MEMLLTTPVALTLIPSAREAMAGNLDGPTNLTTVSESLVMMLKKDKRGPGQQKMVKDITDVSALLGQSRALIGY